MGTLTTDNDEVFEIEFGGPVSVTENMVFLAKIINSNADRVHSVFKYPENTSRLTLKLTEADEGTEYTGYTRYAGFSIENDGSILVTLKKQL